MNRKIFFATLSLTFALTSCNDDDDSKPEVTVVPDQLTVSNSNFFPEDIYVYDNQVYISGLGDGSLQKYDLTQTPASIKQVAAALDATYTSRWGIEVDAANKTIVSIVNAPYFFNGKVTAPAKIVSNKLSDYSQVASWTLPEGTVGNSIEIVNGYYYIGDFGPNPRIIKLDPKTGKTTIKTDAQWTGLFGFGGIVAANNGLYAVQGGKMWYLPIDTKGDLGIPVAVSGLSNVFADGMTWADNNILYYATNDANNPANVGTVWKVTFTDKTTATIAKASSLNNPSGVFYTTINQKNYLLVNESQLQTTPTLPFKVIVNEIK